MVRKLSLTTVEATSIHLIAPESLLPHTIEAENIERFTDIESGLKEVDVIITLRLQKERMDAEHTFDEAAYIHHFCLTPERLALAKPDAIVMHPGPMNRGIEISDAVADGEQAIILDQAANGVFMRMALLKFVNEG